MKKKREGEVPGGKEKESGDSGEGESTMLAKMRKTSRVRGRNTQLDKNETSRNSPRRQKKSMKSNKLKLGGGASASDKRQLVGKQIQSKEVLALTSGTLLNASSLPAQVQVGKSNIKFRIPKKVAAGKAMPQLFSSQQPDTDEGSGESSINKSKISRTPSANNSSMPRGAPLNNVGPSGSSTQFLRKPLKAERRSLERTGPLHRNRELRSFKPIPERHKLENLDSRVEDLPYYEDQEGMELDNPIPEILRMVKADSAIEQPSHCEEVTEMEVDLDSKTEQTLTIVPDTNIWISNLQLINDLLTTKLPKSVFVVIPWMVLQELDVGMHQKTGPSGGTPAAQRPVKYIHSLLVKRDPRVRAQKSYDAALSKLKYDELMADDSILNCAIQSKRSNTTVIFLSNDRNLLNKALVHGITAADADQAMTTIRQVIGGSTECDRDDPSRRFFSGPSGPPASSTMGESVSLKRPSTSSFVPVHYQMDQDEEMMEEVSLQEPQPKVRANGQDFSCSVSPSFEVLEKTLLKVFSHIIQKKMVDDYGTEGWQYPLKYKPPWTLRTALKCIAVHWIANFSYVFSRQGQKYLEALKTLVENNASTKMQLPKETVQEMLETSLALLNFLNKEYERDSVVLEGKQILLGVDIRMH